MIPESIKKFSDAFAKLPGIGPRQAIRLAYYLAENDRATLAELKEAVERVADLKPCRQCFYVHNGKGELCSICSNPARVKSVIAIVEKATDLMSLEKTKKYSGRYLVLGDLARSGVLEMEPKLRLAALKNQIAKDLGGKAREIILAINPTPVGDLNASMLVSELNPHTEKLTRLGRGIPTGGEIEFADEETLGAAIEGRN